MRDAMDRTFDNLDPADDALLTAYALGECADPAEQAAAERLLADVPAAGRAVAEVRATARALADGLKGEPGTGLTAVHVAGIERRLGAAAGADAGGPHLPRRRRPRRDWGLWGSVAASTLIVATVMGVVLPKVFRVGPAGGTGTGGGRPGDGIVPPAGGAAGGNLLTLQPPATAAGGSGELAVAAASQANTGYDADDWPILKTSAGGLPWPTVVGRRSGLYERAFVVPSDFPLAVIPPAPTYAQASAGGTVQALTAALAAGRLPAPQGVRADEIVNHLRVEDLPPGPSPVVAKVESAVCPWESGHLLVRVAVRNVGYAAPATDPADDLPVVPAPSGPAGQPATPATQPAAAGTVSAASSPIAPLIRDLRLAVEVNPAAVAGYRVVGYENGPRSWGEWAGRDDHEVTPAGTTFTALLEVIPAGQPLPDPPATAAAPMKYGRPHTDVVTSSELLTVAVEYRQGPAASPVRVELPVSVEAAAIELTSPDFRAAAGAAALGLSLREPTPYDEPTLDAAIKLLADVTATSPAADRVALLDLARRVKTVGR